VPIRAVTNPGDIIGIVKYEGDFKTMACLEKAAQEVGLIGKQIHIDWCRTARRFAFGKLDGRPPFALTGNPD
jgi:hypothetical protein